MNREIDHFEEKIRYHKHISKILEEISKFLFEIPSANIRAIYSPTEPIYSF